MSGNTEPRPPQDRRLSPGQWALLAALAATALLCAAAWCLVFALPPVLLLLQYLFG